MSYLSVSSVLLADGPLAGCTITTQLESLEHGQTRTFYLPLIVTDLPSTDQIQHPAKLRPFEVLFEYRQDGEDRDAHFTGKITWRYME